MFPPVYMAVHHIILYSYLIYSFHSSNIFELLNSITFLCYHAIMRTLFHPNTSEIQLTAVLYALSDPIRLSMVKTLAGEMN